MANTKQGFKESTWITIGWNWLMTLACKAAEPVLVITTLYYSAKILPMVHLPASLDVVVFLCQFVALDFGGLALSKLALQARSQGNEEGSKQAARLSRWLVGVMLAGVIVALLESIIPANYAPDWLKGVIDALLLVARAIMSILYPRVIHTLGTIDHSAPPALQSDSWQLVGLSAYLQQEFFQALTKQGEELTGMIKDLFAQVEQANNQLKLEDQRLLASIQETKNTPSDLLVQGVCERLRTLFLEQSSVLVQEAKTPQASLPPAEQKQQKNSMPREQKQPIKTGGSDVSRRPRKVLDTEVDAIVWPIKNSDRSLSHRKIAPLTEYSETVVYASLKRWRESQSSVCVESPETLEEAKEESETIG